MDARQTNIAFMVQRMFVFLFNMTFIDLFVDHHLSNVHVRAFFSRCVLKLSVHHNLQATQKQFTETTNKLRVVDVIVVASFSLTNTDLFTNSSTWTQDNKIEKKKKKLNEIKIRKSRKQMNGNLLYEIGSQSEKNHKKIHWRS